MSARRLQQWREESEKKGWPFRPGWMEARCWVGDSGHVFITSATDLCCGFWNWPNRLENTAEEVFIIHSMSFTPSMRRRPAALISSDISFCSAGEEGAAGEASGPGAPLEQLATAQSPTPPLLGGEAATAAAVYNYPRRRVSVTVLWIVLVNQ